LFSKGPFPYLTIAAGTGKADWLLAAKTKVYIIPRLESRQRRIKHIPAVLPEWGAVPAGGGAERPHWPLPCNYRCLTLPRDTAYSFLLGIFLPSADIIEVARG
jgi:hypothetical protein